MIRWLKRKFYRCCFAKLNVEIRLKNILSELDSVEQEYWMGPRDNHLLKRHRQLLVQYRRLNRFYIDHMDGDPEQSRG